jgi:hypothetical protein
MNKMNKTNSWIFVSHSHHDIEKVRQIRNYLEQHGANPLLFFLKCLNDDDARLPELINDEILARNFFVLCESENARNSSWVQQEQAIVMNMDNVVKETIDLEQDIESQHYKLDRICKRATVFISYANPDYLSAKCIREALIKNDYCVWTYPDDMPLVSNYAHTIRKALDEAAKNGFVLHLLSPAALASKHFESEVIYAFQQSRRMNVFPIIIAPFKREEMKDQLRFVLENIQYYDLTSDPFDQRIEELITFLKKQEI